ncbi:MAG: response regulator, partial [Candidatus Omnitrophica bacterium]|nr:response regulator [Candidatus Omnitrophota bacterium]
NPDIILLDLLLPKLNGFEVLKRVKNEFKDRWRPVIIVSTKTELESIKKSYDLEADHYLSKPISLEQLNQAIKTMLSLIPLREK